MEVLLGLYDGDDQSDLVLSAISLITDTWTLRLDYALQGAQGVGDHTSKDIPLQSRSLTHLYDTIHKETHVSLSMSALVLNDDLLDAFLSSFTLKDSELEDYLHVAAQEARNTASDDAAGHLWRIVGLIYEANHHNEQALEAYHRESRSFATSAPLSQLMAGEDMARIVSLEDETLGIALYNGLLEQCPAGTPEQAFLLEKAGLLNQKLYRFEAAIRCHDKQVRLCQKLGAGDFNHALALRELGLAHLTRGFDEDLPKARQALQESLDMMKDMDDVPADDLTVAWEYAGDAYTLLKQGQNALDAYDHVSALLEAHPSEPMDDTLSHAVLWKKRGKAHLARGDDTNAETAFLEAVNLLEEWKDEDISKAMRGEMGIAYMNAGWAMMRRHDYSAAYDWFDKDVRWREANCEQLPSDTTLYALTLAYRHRGYALTELGRLDEALRDLEKCYRWSEGLARKEHDEGRDYYLAYCACDVGEVYLKMNRKEDARTYIEEAYAFMKDYTPSWKHEYVLTLGEVKEALKRCG